VRINAELNADAVYAQALLAIKIKLGPRLPR
jgi:hypothetical protein